VKIERVEIEPYRQVLRLGAGEVVRERFWVHVFGDGLAGLGDAAPWAPPRTASASEVGAELARVAKELEGRRFSELEALVAWLEGLRVASPTRAGLEIALFDLWTRRAGRSFAELFADAPAAEVGTNTLVAGEAAARRAVEGGSGTLKLKILSLEALPGVLEWAARLPARYRIDADRKWPVAETIAAAEALGAIDLEYLEDPLPPEDHAGWRALAAAGLPLALDEGEDDTLLDEGTVKLRVLKPQFDGGFLAVAAAVRRYRARGQGVTVTSALESRVGRAATIHLARALAPEHVHGLGPVEAEAAWTMPVAGRVVVPAHLGVGLERAELG